MFGWFNRATNSIGGERMEGINLNIEKEEIVLRKKLLKDETYKVNNKDNMYSLVIFKKPQWVSGVTSMCEDMKHILMIDWDDTCRWIVESELKMLSKLYTPFYFLKTKEEVKDGIVFGNYHAICLEKFYPHQIVEIHRKTSCDKAYTTMPRRNVFRSWVLRLSGKKGSGKPQYIKTIGRENLRSEISQAHLSLLNKLFKLPKLKYTNKDGFKKIYLNRYETRV